MSRLVKCVFCLFCLLLAGCFPLASHAAGEAETPYVSFNEAFYNPIRVNHMLGDPWMIRHGDSFYYTQSGGDRVYVIKSPTISGLMSRDAFSRNIYLGVQNSQTELWASEIHFYRDRWYAFYAADYDNDNRLHRMYVLRSDTPDALGTWQYVGKLDLPEDQWAIDGTFFASDDGRAFLIWSGWKSEAQGLSLWKQYLYITELDPDDPTRVIGKERVMISKPELYWEMSVLPQNEGPAILRSPTGTVYLCYAANYSGSDDYAIGALRLMGDDPMDATAWEKLPDPILSRSDENQVFAPGHASFTKSPDGTEDWIIYHAAKASGSGWDRSARAQKVEWVDDTPFVGAPLSLDTQIPLPSGEAVDRILIQAEDCALSAGTVIVGGPVDGLAVHFASAAESCGITVSVEQGGVYALYIRHSNPGQTESVLYLSANGAKAPVIASRAGAPGQFTMACALVRLEEGLSSLELSAGPDVDIDLVILDRTPVEE